MSSESKAINRLTDVKSKVSCHYFIKRNGSIILLVPEIYEAWHAGKSGWKNDKFLNKKSIGIEISNKGHQFGYQNFSKSQIKSLIKLSKILIKKYKIKNKCILGHSDIAFNRKKDPGEKFPWEYLSKKKISYWHNLNFKRRMQNRTQKVEKTDKKTFIKNLIKIGYSLKLNHKNIKYLKLITKAFQRRFRPELVNGLIDKECLLISINLVKKFS